MANDGQVVIDVSLDTSKIPQQTEQASKKIGDGLTKNIGKSVNEVEKNVGKIGTAFSKIKVGDLGNQFKKVDSAINKTNSTIENQKKKLEELKKAYDNASNPKSQDKISQQMKNAELSIERAQKQLDKLNNKKINLNSLKDAGNGLDGNFSSASMKITKDLDNIEKKAQETGKVVKSSLSNISLGDSVSKVGQSLNNVGNTLSTRVTLPLVGLGVTAAKVGMDFDSSMSRVKAISGATGDEFKQLHDQALQLGADTAFSAKEAATGMEGLAAAGFTTKETMQAMPGLLDLAASSGENLATSTDIAASTLRGFGLEADQAGHVADVLAKNANATNAAVADTGEAMKYVAPVAHSMGLSLEEVTAAIGEMANSGIQGSMAGTTLRSALTRLASPSKEAAGAMASIGFNAFDSQGKLKSLSDIMEGYNKALQGKTDQQKQDLTATIFGQEAMSGMLVLMQGGKKGLDDLTNSYKNADGAASDMAKTMQDNSKSAVEQMFGSLETAAIKVEEGFAPTITQLANYIGELADQFANLSPEQQQFYVKMLAGAAAAGPFLKIIGSLTSGIGGLINVSSKIGSFFGLGTVAAALGTLGVAIAATNTANSQMKQSLTTTTDGMSEWEKAINGMTGYTFKSKKELQDLGIEYKDFGDNISDDFKKKVEDATKSVDNFQLFLGKINLDGIIDSAESSDFNNQISKMVNDAINTISSKKSEMQQKMSDFFKSDDGTIDEKEQKELDYITQGYDNQISQENQLKTEILAIKQKAVDEKRSLNDQEIKDVQDKVSKIKEIELDAAGGTQEEHDYAKNEFAARAESVSPEDAAALLQDKKKTLDEQNVQIKASYDTQLGTLKQHLKEEQDAINNATTEEERQKAQADAQNTQAEIDKFSNLKDKKLKMTQDEWQEYINILKQKNPEALAMVNEFTGEMLNKEDKLSEGRLSTAKATYAGLSNIVKSGTYELENTQTGSMESVTVSVDESTKKITGAYSDTAGAIGGYTDQMEKDNAKLGQAHAELAAQCQTAMQKLGDSHVSADGKIMTSSGDVVGALEQVKTASDGTTTGIYNLNGTPIAIKTNADGTISNLADVIEKISQIPKGTQTDIKINGEEINTVDAAKEKLDEIAKENPEAKIKINGEEIGTVDEAKEKLDNIPPNTSTEITVDSSTADGQIDTTTQKAEDLGAEQPNVDATANTSDADNNLDATKGKAEELDGKNPNINVTANTAAAKSGLDGIMSDIEYILAHPLDSFNNFVGEAPKQEKYTGTNYLRTGFSTVNEHGWETANNGNVNMISNGLAFLVGHHYSGGDGINSHMTSVNEMNDEINSNVNNKFGLVVTKLINALYATANTQSNLLNQVANNTGEIVNTSQKNIKLNEDLAKNIVNKAISTTGTFSTLESEITSANNAKDKADKMKVEDNYWYSSTKAQYDDIQSQIDALKDKSKDLTDSIDEGADETSKKSVEAEKNELEKQQRVLEKQKDSLEKSVNYYKDAAQKEIDTCKENAEQQVKIAEEKKDKLTKLAEATTTAIKNQLELEKASAEKVINDELTKLETDYNNAVTKIENTTKKKTDKIDKEIKDLENQNTEDSRDKDRTDANNNINKLNTMMNNTASIADKRSLQLQIDEAKKALQEKEDSWDIEDEKAALEEEKNALSESEENQKKDLETKYNANKKAKEKELKETDEYYDKLLEEDSINAQARYTLLNSNSQELVTLLNSYAPNWQDAGQSLSDSLLTGLNSQKQSIKDAVDEMISLRKSVSTDSSSSNSSSNNNGTFYETIDGYASGTDYNPYAGLYNVDEKGWETSDNGSVAYVSKGAAIKNHMQSVADMRAEVTKQLSVQLPSILSDLKSVVQASQADMQRMLVNTVNNTNNTQHIKYDGSNKFQIENLNLNTGQDVEQLFNEAESIRQKNRRF